MTAQPREAELRSPAWQLSEDARRPALGAVARRIGSAIRPVFNLLRRCAPYRALTVLAAQITASLLTSAGFLLSARIFTRLLAGETTAAAIRAAVPTLIVLGVVVVARLAFEAVANLLKAHFAPKLRRLAEEDLIQISLAVELEIFDDATFYERLHRARDRGVLHLEGAANSLFDAAMALSIVAGSSVALFLLQPILLFVLILAALPEAWSALAAARVQYSGMARSVELTRQLELMTALATERAAAAEIRATQVAPYVLAEFDHFSNQLQDHVVGMETASARLATIGRFLGSIGMLLTFISLGILLDAKWIDLAVAGVAALAIRCAGSSLTQLARTMSELFQKALYISDYRSFVETYTRRSQQCGNLQATTPKDIVLDHVSFAYAGHDANPALEDVSVHIRAGETVAFVGENGSGKTTLGKIIAGLYRPTSGSVRWNGIDLIDMTQHSVAACVTLVPQEPIHWPRSARDNVRLGLFSRVDPDDAALDDAAYQSRCDEVIERLPIGWHTLLSQEFAGGQELSKGQWQRLAIARGFYRDTPIVIWDEATAPLDARAECAINGRINQTRAGKTTIIITHRFAGIRDADRIFVLSKGRIVEDGTHDSLLKLNGIYAALFLSQSGKEWGHDET